MKMIRMKMINSNREKSIYTIKKALGCFLLVLLTGLTFGCGNSKEGRIPVPSVSSNLPASGQQEYTTEEDYKNLMADLLNKKYNTDFTAEDISIFNVSRPDGNVVFEAMCYSDEYSDQFRVYLNQAKLSITDDYERFLYGNDIIEMLGNLTAECPLELTGNSIFYGMTSTVATDITDYLTNSDTYLSISVDCGDGLTEEELDELYSFCNTLSSASFCFNLNCTKNMVEFTYYQSPLHGNTISEGDLDGLLISDTGVTQGS